MKTSRLDLPVMSSWMLLNGLRLDSGPYLSGALEARAILDKLKARKQPLQEVTKGGMDGLLNPGRIQRNWVNHPEFGIPFLSSTDILQADLSTVSFISKKSVDENPRLLLDEGWTLITRSGTIGRMAYCRSDMAGMACTEHVLRVIPDDNKIPPGYLYAYLSSRFGVPLIVSGTYGAIIQHIEPRHIADLPVPRLGEEIERRVHELVVEAARNRSEASLLISNASRSIVEWFGWDQPMPLYTYQHPNVAVANSSSLHERMDAYYYAEWNCDAYNAFSGFRGACSELESVVQDVFIPGIFKREYADDPAFGHSYITGADVYQLAPTSNKYLANSLPSIDKLLLHDGMILVQDSGQLGGLIGRPVPVGRYLDGFACTNNMVRIVPESKSDQGYLFALLNTSYGVWLLTREATGSSIPHLDERRIRRIKIPWPSNEVRSSLGEPVVKAVALRDEACDFDIEARRLVEAEINEGAI